MTTAPFENPTVGDDGQHYEYDANNDLWVIRPVTVTLADGQVTTPKLLDGAVSAQKIAAGAVTQSKLAAAGTPSEATFLRGDFVWASPPAAVGGDGPAVQVQNTPPDPAEGVTWLDTSGRLMVYDGAFYVETGVEGVYQAGDAGDPPLGGDLSGTASAAQINANSITSGKILAGAVTTPKLADGAVTSGKIADGAIVDSDINSAAAIALSKLAVNPLARSNHTGTQAAATISDLAAAIGGTSLGGVLGGTVAAATLANNAVTAAKITDGAVTQTKLSATGTPDNTKFLRGDWTWATVSGVNSNQLPATVVTGLVASSQPAAAANRAAIQAALNSGAGRVVIPVGLYWINGTLTIPDGVVLCGMSLLSILKLADGTATAISPVSMVQFAASANRAGVETLTLDGNWSNQTDSGRASHGITFARTPAAASFDGGLWARRVVARSCAGAGFHLDGVANTPLLVACEALDNWWGFYGRSDQLLVGCSAQLSRNVGFEFNGGRHITFAGCSSYGSAVAEWRLVYCQHVAFDGCVARDFGSTAGVVLRSCSYVRGDVIIDGCAVAGEQTGLWVEDDDAASYPHHIDLRVTVSAESSAQPLKYALATRRLGDQVRLRVQTGTVTVAAYRNVAGAGAETADIRIGNPDGIQQVPYAATITPNPLRGGIVVVGQLTGPLTVANPTESIPGATMEMHLQQDGTGGRAVTFGSQFQAGAVVAASAGARTVLRWRCLTPTLWALT